MRRRRAFALHIDNQRADAALVKGKSLPEKGTPLAPSQRVSCLVFNVLVVWVRPRESGQYRRSLGLSYSQCHGVVGNPVDFGTWGD